MTSGSAPSPTRPNYGVDAPWVIAFFLLAGGGGALASGFALGHGAATPWRPLLSAALTTGAIFAIEGVLMLAYSLAGKYRHRDRMLAAVEWRGDERVLDVGTGRGLLAVGAARRGAAVRVVAIDIWSAKDLSSNSAEAARHNAALAGVGERVEVRDGDARRLDFPERSFDVVLSNLCLHNIPGSEARAQACREIARVLAPGGVALISDFRHTADYARQLSACGLEVTRGPLHAFTTFPPLRVVRAVSPDSHGPSRAPTTSDG